MYWTCLRLPQLLQPASNRQRRIQFAQLSNPVCNRRCFLGKRIATLLLVARQLLFVQLLAACTGNQSVSQSVSQFLVLCCCTWHQSSIFVWSTNQLGQLTTAQRRGVRRSCTHRAPALGAMPVTCRRQTLFELAAQYSRGNTRRVDVRQCIRASQDLSHPLELKKRAMEACKW